MIGKVYCNTYLPKPGDLFVLGCYNGGSLDGPIFICLTEPMEDKNSLGNKEKIIECCCLRKGRYQFNNIKLFGVNRFRTSFPGYIQIG